jgi:hypothetical protein
MCRLTLLNRQAVTLLQEGGALAAILKQLECSFGGHGNGVAALWSAKERVKMQKGVKLSTEAASQMLTRAAAQGADWMLFHTRRASSSAIADQHCHPFRVGKLTLAHNGHDPDFARLGRGIGVTDTELIAKTWACLRLPLAALDECTGVFIGFQRGAPFVVKGSPQSDLIAAWHEGTGAVLFASEIPSWLVEGVFDQVVEVRRLAWFGRTLDRITLDAVPYHPHMRARASRFSLSTQWGYTDHYYADLADLAEEEEAFYNGLVDEDEAEMEVDKEGNIVTSWEMEHQWGSDWRQGRQVEDEHNVWRR